MHRERGEKRRREQDDRRAEVYRDGGVGARGPRHGALRAARAATVAGSVAVRQAVFVVAGGVPDLAAVGAAGEGVGQSDAGAGVLPEPAAARLPGAGAARGDLLRW